MQTLHIRVYALQIIQITVDQAFTSFHGPLGYPSSSPPTFTIIVGLPTVLYSIAKCCFCQIFKGHHELWVYSSIQITGWKGKVRIFPNNHQTASPDCIDGGGKNIEKIGEIAPKHTAQESEAPKFLM